MQFDNDMRKFIFAMQFYTSQDANAKANKNIKCRE